MWTCPGFRVEGSDFVAISRLATEFNRVETIARLRELCERWIYSTCLCFALPTEERRRVPALRADALDEYSAL
jgi:hypothetical protein